LFIAEKKCGNGFKETLVETYAILMRSIGKTRNQPFYARYDKQPKIPKEEKINMIISHAKRRMSLFLSMSRDLGSRPIELTWLKVGDIDLKNGTVNITGAKHTIGRIGKLKANTLEMLRMFIMKKGLKTNDRVFPTTSKSICNSYRKLRNALAEQLNDTELHQIRLYDFRHFKASMEYDKTKDLLYVKQLLGHKDLRTTLRYTQLINIQDNDEWTCKATRNTEEAMKLIEVGFQIVTTTPDGTMLFKKRK
jgi:integrase